MTILCQIEICWRLHRKHIPNPVSFRVNVEEAAAGKRQYSRRYDDITSKVIAVQRGSRLRGACNIYLVCTCDLHGMFNTILSEMLISEGCFKIMAMLLRDRVILDQRNQ